MIAILLCCGRIELDDEKEQWLSQEMSLLADELTDCLMGKLAPPCPFDSALD
jgi:hypothetical protein